MAHKNEKGRNGNETCEKTAAGPIKKCFQQQSVHFLKKSEEKRLRMRQEEKNSMIFQKSRK
ncbi:hypothetical protein P4284_17160 [Bacillus swezeyi]|uniref:hypothetical protein n=1 Tax=Bacillus swezeyi TaxID=1925020 RepID=UPI0016534EDF|nr:hypothetical protein [Bacillus swezeyi]MED1739175.1 hypothetical protein [Bacillus swezeyi]MED2944111.1 hypothetical protein [Bacillus swezeyi]MED2978418.1 hypothetical protein [Bacillus swezeyi]